MNHPRWALPLGQIVSIENTAIWGYLVQLTATPFKVVIIAFIYNEESQDHLKLSDAPKAS